MLLHIQVTHVCIKAGEWHYMVLFSEEEKKTYIGATIYAFELQAMMRVRIAFFFATV